MGKKKNSAAVAASASAVAKVYCYFCDKEFEDDRVLIQHQLTKHFRCGECRSGSSGKCNTLHGLIIHYRKVHTAELKIVPNALPGRDDPIPSMQIVGMRCVPEEILEGWRQKSILQETITEPEKMAQGTAALMAAGTGAVADMLGSLPQLQSAPAVSDWQSQVAAFMAQKKVEEEPPPLPEVEEPPPPVPELQHQVDSNGFLYPPASQFSAPPGSVGFSAPQAVEDQGRFQPMQGFPFQPAAVPAATKAQAQDQAANFLVEALGNLQASRQSSQIQAMSAPPRGPTMPPNLANATSSGGRSRSRGRRSRSRGGGGGAGGAPPAGAAPAPGTFESRTINITLQNGGVVSSRLWLKKEMERFGRVEVCHTGNRQNPIAEPPWVRFEKMSSVETALTAINSGAVLLDGVPVTATLKAAGRPQASAREPARRSPKRGDLEVTSRDLARDDRNRRVDDNRSGPRGYQGSRGGDRDRQDSARDDIRSRQGPGNYSSRDLYLAQQADRSKKRGRSSSSSRDRRRRR